jgi:hypothetical protein
MDRESCLGLVGVLTELVVTEARPEKLADFAADFGDFLLKAGTLQVSERLEYRRPHKIPGQGLDTTLVAGMFFEVLLEASQLPAGPRERVSFVRKKAKDYLVTRLAGQITLSQFYRLLNLIEERVESYFEHLTADWVGVPRRREAPGLAESGGIEGEALRQALARLALPLKGNRKLSPETLWDFFSHHGGAWFRLLDFEAHFQVNKKTAWTYLNLLLTAGLLEHNGEKANKVRYSLAPPFRADSPNSLA